MPLKKFVLDTNVLLHDPDCIFKFKENAVFIPITVLEELDKKKSGGGEIAYSARQAIRLIDGLRGQGNLAKGVSLPGGGSLKVVVNDKSVLSAATNDNRIISVAFKLMKDGGSGDIPVILVSKDSCVRVKAEALGLEVQDYRHDKTVLYKDHGHIIEGFKNLGNGIKSVRYVIEGDALWRVWGSDNKVQVKRNRTVMGIKPKNIEQEAALAALLAKEISVVAIGGIAGSGKTLLSMAAGLYMVDKKAKPGAYGFDHVIVSRPIVPIGNDLGSLPGDVEDKFRPWLQPIIDNLDLIVGTPGEEKDNKKPKYKSSDYLLKSGAVQVQPLTYIRGRSLPGIYFCMDESQQLRPVDIKTLITRCGEGSKMVLCGDLAQIDTVYLDAPSTGLAYLIDRFIDEEDFCYIQLKQGARSSLAERAARLL